MKVAFLDQSLETDDLEHLDQFQAFLAAVTGQNKELYPKRKDSTNSKVYEKFDKLTPREVALKNLHFVLGQAIESLKKEIFPANIARLVKAATSYSAEEAVKIPEVSFIKYGDLQKISYLQNYLAAYLALEIQTRLGFGLNLTTSDDGTIYALKDLRELFKAAV